MKSWKHKDNMKQTFYNIESHPVDFYNQNMTWNIFDAAYNVAWLLSLVLFTHESELTITYSTVHLKSNILLSRLFFWWKKFKLLSRSSYISWLRTYLRHAKFWSESFFLHNADQTCWIVTKDFKDWWLSNNWIMYGAVILWNL